MLAEVGVERANMALVPRKIRVLLVEDDPLSAFNTKRALRQVEEIADVTVAIDGRDALDRLRSGAFDGELLVIVTDLSMPRMSGLELAKAIGGEAALERLPIVVLTTSTDDAERQAALALNVSGFFVKSYAGTHLGEVVAWLREYCARA
jgi:CheY-like chemotaxis protein